MKKWIYFGCVYAVHAIALSETLSFEQVWNKVKKSSSAIEATELLKQSVEEAYRRSNRHWMPRLYLDIKAYQTNDPASNFMGLLEQRSVAMTDFNPSDINGPVSKTFGRGALGVDLPIYEGGSQVAHSDLMDAQLKVAVLRSAQVKNNLYAETATSYIGLANLETQKNKISNLKKNLDSWLKGYQIGSTSNPVGYSGLLGMKALNGRLQSLLIMYQTQESIHYKNLQELGVNSTSWSTEKTSVTEFVKSYFLSLKSTSDFSLDNQISQQQTKVAKSESDMQKSKYLPRLGAFAESYLFTGDKNTKSGYTAGLYLQWSLFNPDEYGSYAEAQLKMQALQKQSGLQHTQNQTELYSLNQTIKLLTENLKILEETSSAFDQQIRISEKLFRNGSINALQLLDVLNRYTDLIVQQAESENKLIETATRWMAAQDTKVE